jgi:hypothetical protein
MFRFTIRDVLWLTVVAALAVALWLEHRQLTVVRDALRTAQGGLHTLQAERRMAELRARELRGGVILTPAPATGIRMLERGGHELPRAKDE